MMQYSALEKIPFGINQYHTDEKSTLYSIAQKC